MAEDLKTQLARIYADRAENLNPGRKHPPYNDLSIAESYARFCAELANIEIRDPRGTAVVILEQNFPKLLGMKMADPATGEPMIDANTGRPRKAKASRVLEDLRNGTFQDAAHVVERGRMRTLFWIPEVISAPDSIHPNAHPVVAGDEVYVKRYTKEGSEIKLVVTAPAPGGRRIIVTSFLTNEADLRNYVEFPPIWP